MRQPSSSTSPTSALTDRQRQCLDLAAHGLTSAQIGAVLGLSPRTIDEHLAEACRGLGVRTRIQAVARHAAAAPCVRDDATVDLRRGTNGSMLKPRQG
ncbi:helix-turn-helix domain-containing protein [Brevundimonas faecalis]|uniref:LuxR family transcriptional regulator of spore coat protein n=1 Tax=Brevundimonas faecalis TaxID=947378 RepID=A0ABV2R8M0_9CAUL